VHFAGTVGQAVLEVYPLRETDAPTECQVRLGFQVRDIHGALKALQAFGSPLQNPPVQTPTGLRAVVKDPDGRAVELYSDVSEPVD
jgi:predicted enzyme related to lactoylglutathione lyase